MWLSHWRGATLAPYKMIPQNILILEAILFGLVIGSFLNVCIYRIPQKMGLGGRSACPHCKQQVAWFDNVPVISFVFLLGKCRKCKTPISVIYPVVELITGALALATLYRVHFEIIPFFLWFLLFVCPLIVISFIDLEHQIIPDVISLPGIPIGVAVNLFTTSLTLPTALIQSGLGILVGGGSLLLISQVYYWVRKREGLGGGDIKLCAMFGAFLGWRAMLFIFFASSILALVFALGRMIVLRTREGSVIPYGPFLSMAALIYFFAGEKLISAYFQASGLRPPFP